MAELKGKSLSEIKERKGYFEFSACVRDGVLVKTRYLVAYDKTLKEFTSQMFEKRAYGLLFFRCGYDGKMQSELISAFAKKGVYVF